MLPWFLGTCPVHSSRRAISLDSQSISPYLFLPESLKPLAKGFLSIFNLVIYERRIRELVHLLKKYYSFNKLKLWVIATLSQDTCMITFGMFCHRFMLKSPFVVYK